MMKEITVFKGDGIGPEISDAVMCILHAADTQLHFDCYEVGEAEYHRNGKLIPDAAYASFERTHVLLKAPITTPLKTGFSSLNVHLRTRYALYANIRPAKSIPSVVTPFPNVDLIVFRENTEDLYVGVEEQIDEDTVHATKIITRKACERIIRDAFTYAKEHHRKRVTCVHKANILKKSDGMFLSIFQQIQTEYPEIKADDLIIDNCCMQLVMHPQDFDVMVMPNLYGDIVSDLTSGLIGGLGLLPSSNLGRDYAMFEAVHGSAPDIAGKHIANPTALLLSSCMMLDAIQKKEAAASIRSALYEVLEEGVCRTPDLHGTATTEEFRDAVIQKLQQVK